MNVSDRNSKAASDFAAKKQLQLARAAELRMQRDASAASSSAAANVRDFESRSSRRSFDQAVGLGPTGSGTGSASVEISSYGDFCEKIVIRGSSGRGGSSSAGGGGGAYVSASALGFPSTEHAGGASSSSSSSGRVTSKRTQDILERARKTAAATTTSSTTSSSTTTSSTSRLPSESSQQQQSHMLSPRALALDSVEPVFGMCRTSHSHKAHSSSFLRPPADPAGRLVDLSDRPLLCSSSNMRGEVVFGSADHALYAVDTSDPRSPRIQQMYSKRCGHTDWITSVTHLTDGRVLSASMDAKLCLWAVDRRTCVDLSGGHDKSISKVISDCRFNLALSCGYDNKAALWRFSSARDVPRGPVEWLVGHKDAIVDCLFMDNIAATASRSGSLLMWDLTSFQQLRSYQAHKGSITAMDCGHFSSSSDGSTTTTMGSTCFISGGADGMVKVWDCREKAGAVLRCPAHVQEVPTVSSAPAAAAPSAGGRGGRPRPSVTAGGAVPAAAAVGDVPAGPKLRGSSVSCVAAVLGRGGSEVSLVVSAAADNTVAVMDARMNMSVVARHSHHRTGVYSMCVIGDSCVMSGDGAGMMLCYNILVSDDSVTAGGGPGTSALQYGVGASSTGAVRSINCLDGKVVTGAEDGKALIFQYS